MRIAIYTPATGQHDRFTNEGLDVGDEVWPLTHGWTDDNNVYHVTDIQKWVWLEDGRPHIIRNLRHSESKPYEVATDKGYGPRESYFKKISP